MKKITLAIMILCILIAMVGCGKSEEVKNAEEKIGAIGEVTADSKSLIDEAEAALEKVTGEELEKVANKDVLEQAKKDFQMIQNELSAAEIDEAITKIGNVTLECEAIISSARKMYDETSADVQSLVTKIKDLEEAEQKYLELEAGQVIEVINAIGEVTSDSNAKIVEARKAYDELSEAAKEKVTNYNVLEEAEAAYKAAVKSEADALLAGMRLDEDKVNRVKFYYPKNMSWYDSNTWAADLRSFIVPYIGVQDDFVYMRLIMNYTGSDWVFFEDLIFAADEKRYTKSFSYYDVVRDNGGGRVWEYVDIPVNNEELEILDAIANSEETIIRFQGEDYSYDLTVTAGDKQGIKDALKVYNALKQ